MLKEMLNWPVMNFLTFLYLCLTNLRVETAESIAALGAAAGSSCVFPDQMAY